MRTHFAKFILQFNLNIFHKRVSDDPQVLLRFFSVLQYPLLSSDILQYPQLPSSTIYYDNSTILQYSLEP